MRLRNRVGLFLLGLMLACAPAHATDIYALAHGSCEQGGNQITVNGIQSQQYVQQSFPACTVTVYSHGSMVLATLFSDAAGSVPLANPFTATSNGVADFYAADGSYDVQYSGAGIITPFTVPNIQLCFACSGGGGSGITGNGTAGFLPLWTGTSSIGNSAAQDNGSTLTYGGTAFDFAANGIITSQTPGSSLTFQAPLNNAGNGGFAYLLGASSGSATGASVQAFGATQAGIGGDLNLFAGLGTNALAGGNIVLSPGPNAGNQGAGILYISRRSSSTPMSTYLGISLYSSLPNPPLINPDSASSDGAILYCSDCKGAIDGATAGAIAAGSGSGAYVSWDGTNWRNFTGLGGSGGGGNPASPSLSWQYNNAGSFGAIAGSTISTTPSGAASPDLSIFNNTYYAPAPAISTTTCGANWSQSPSGTISTGATTLTLSCGPPGLLTNNIGGFSGTTNWTYIAVSGSGGTEYDPLTSTTCNAQGQSSSCTITFTAVANQNAGFTVGTASQGLQETINAAMRTIPGETGYSPAIGYADIKIPPGDYTAKATVSALAAYGGVNFDFSGAIITCTMSATCFRAGDISSDAFANSFNFYNMTFRPGVVASYYPAFEDNGYKVHTYNLSVVHGTTSGPVTGMSFGALEQVDADEAYLIDGMQAAPLGATWTHCSTDFISNAIYITPAGTAPTGAVSNSNLQMGACGNGIDNWGGNGIRVSNTQIQGWDQYPLRTKGGFSTNLNAQLDNIYWERGTVPDILGTGAVSIAAQAGVVLLNGSLGGPTGVMPRFSNTGATQLNVYASACNGASCTPPYPIGYAASDLSTAFTITWPEFGSTGPPTYTLSTTSGTTPFAPYTAVCGGGSKTTCGTIATGLTQAGNCNGQTCTYSYTPANTTAYTVPIGAYFASLIGTHGSGCGAAACGVPPLPATVLLSGAENAGVTSQTFATISSPNLANGMAAGTGPPLGITAAQGNNLLAVNAEICTTGAMWAATWVNCNSDYVAGYGAKLQLLTNANKAGIYGTQGQEIFTTPPSSTVQGRHIITLLNTHPEITLTDPSASLYATTPWNSTDSFIAIDNPAGNVALTAASLGFGNNVSISNYIGSNPDNTSWLERLTATAKTLKVPLTFSGTAFAFNSPEVSAPATPASGTQSCYASAGNGLACKDSAGTVYTMTPPGSGTNYQTVQNAGSALPTEPTLNMIITGGACVDNPGSTRTDCTVPGAGTVTTFSAGSLSPLFTTSVATATTTPALTFSLTNAGGGTLFGRSSTSAGAPSYTISPVLGIAGTSTGTLGFSGATSGTATVTPQTAAGSPTLTLPNTTGTFAVGASAPLVLNTTTGNLTGPTIVTAAGLTNQRIPVASGAQALVDSCLTSNGTQVTNTCTGGFIAGAASSANMLMTGVSGCTDALCRVTLSGGSGSHSFAGTYVTAPGCMFRDETTPANAVTPSVTTSGYTLTGTGTDVVLAMCMGFN